MCIRDRLYICYSIQVLEECLLARQAISNSQQSLITLYKKDYLHSKNNLSLLLIFKLIFYRQFKKFENIYYPMYSALIPCLLYTSPSPRDKRQSRMPSSA
eukprot:TRINITY_DN979_c0_g1_i2.p2 TRINITY_DN979_c0_g1~~TRINITY_DN979_c0_g1_i2.p2  ORF type:complete len:100 (+),score=31.84 TRINITY_DN979_c0_g1_i2:61-360(+)